MRQHRKNRRPGNKAMTADEAAWVDKVKRYGCVCCIEMGFPHDPDGSVVEAHHLLEGGLRIDHYHTVGICLWHHKARLIVNGWGFTEHRIKLGPSLHEGSVPFESFFGGNDWLMEKQHEILEAACA